MCLAHVLVDSKKLCSVLRARKLSLLAQSAVGLVKIQVIRHATSVFQKRLAVIALLAV
jgi:hypothetical protein